MSENFLFYLIDKDSEDTTFYQFKTELDATKKHKKNSKRRKQKPRLDLKLHVLEELSRALSDVLSMVTMVTLSGAGVYVVP